MPKKIDPEDSALFRGAVAGARELPPKPDIAKRPPPKPKVSFFSTDKEVALKEYPNNFDQVDQNLEASDYISFSRPGVQHAVLRKLRRGQYAIQADIDLHGLTRINAKHYVSEFLVDCQRRGIRYLRIVHGKGQRSPNGRGILKDALVGWLSQRDDVLAFCSAPDREGGTGAIYLILRRSE